MKATDPVTGHGALPGTPNVAPMTRLPETSTTVGPLVLVVDDDQHAREGLAEFLVGCGFRVTEASDGPEALRKAIRRRPDIVLLDLAIPRLDGWTVARTLKADPVFADVPVIALSGLDYPDERSRAVESGCDAFIAKPCDLNRLLDTVRQLLAMRRF
jgi:two-component system, cell cycle response regulator DivK